MELNDILAIAGMPGLFKKIGQHKNGLIVEALDGTGKKIPTGANTKVSLLADVAMFTMDGEEKLASILITINKLEKDGLEIPNKKSDDKAFPEFLGKVLPTYDNEKVYLSDIKKLTNWYGLLKDNLDFVALEKSLSDANELDTDETKTDKAKAETKAKAEKVVKTANAKGNSKSKGTSVGTIRKMA